MKMATFDVQLSEIKKNPTLYKGGLFILGGIIVSTTATEKGSLIEAVHVPVDSMGYLRGIGYVSGRYLAIYPKDRGVLDSMMYRKQREVTLAGKFIGLKSGQGMIHLREYVYPIFEIKELYLWNELKTGYYPDELLHAPSDEND
jgi:outer membrane lipoprotein